MDLENQRAAGNPQPADDQRGKSVPKALTTLEQCQQQMSRIRIGDLERVPSICNILDDHFDTFAEKVGYLRNTQQTLEVKKSALLSLRSAKHAKRSKIVLLRGVKDNIARNLLLPDHFDRTLESGESYFYCCWWLLYLNAFNFLLICLLLIVPHNIYNIVQGKFFHSEGKAYSAYSGQTWFFATYTYGYVLSRNFEGILPVIYSVQVTYFLAAVMIFVSNFMAAAVQLIRTCNEIFSHGYNAEKEIMVCKVFGSWNFKISTHHDAAVAHHSFCQDVKQVISEYRKPWKSSLFANLCRGFVHLLVFSIVLGISYVLFIFFDKIITQLPYALPNADAAIDPQLALKRVTKMTTYGAIFISAISIAFYTCLRLAKKSDFQEKKSTIVGVLLLKSIILFMVLKEWLRSDESSKLKCSEVEFGRLIFQLILINFLVSMFFFIILKKWLFCKVLCFVQDYFEIDALFIENWTGKFDTAYLIADLIYTQELCWLGVLFEPAIIVLNLTLCYLVIYLESTALLTKYKPVKRLQIKDVRILFLVFVLASCLYALVCLVLVIYRMPSSDCGPFENYSSKIEMMKKFLFYVPFDEFSSEEWLGYFSSKPIALFLAACFLLVLTITIRGHAQAQTSLVKDMHETLKLIREDKQFLRRNLQKMSENRK